MFVSNGQIGGGGGRALETIARKGIRKSDLSDRHTNAHTQTSPLLSWDLLFLLTCTRGKSGQAAHTCQYVAHVHSGTAGQEAAAAAKS